MSAAMRQEIERNWQQARAFHAEGRLGLAESHYQRVVKLDPSHAEAWHLLGVAAFQSGNAAKALKHFGRALELRPRFAEASNNRALALKALGRVEEARATFAQALAIRPEYYEAAFNLALLHETAGDAVAAEAAYRQALAWRPDAAAVLTNLGNMLRRARRSAEALELLERACDSDRDADSLGNLALALADLGRYGEASRHAESALRLAPADPHWREIAGAMARLAGDIDRALALLTPSAGDAVTAPTTWFELGLAREAAGDYAGALEAYASAGRAMPDTERLHWAEALALPTVPDDDAVIDAALRRFTCGLEALHARVRDVPRECAPALLDAALTTTPFALGHLPRDSTELHRRYGELVQAAVARTLPEFAAPVVRSARNGGRIRIGVVSAHLGQHTVARYFADLIAGLDPARFERLVWHTGEPDARWQQFARTVDEAQVWEDSVPALAQSIRAREPEIMLFPDLGMDARQLVLAACRLAPHQVALYGHPVTSGLAAIDVFASAAALEPANGDTHYVERLVRLPGLGAAPRPPDTAPDRAWADSRRGRGPLLVCAQNLAKFTPAFDQALLRILAQSDARLLVFDRVRAQAERWYARIARAAHSLDLDLNDRIDIAPVRPYPEFLGALVAADLVLDTPWFSGGSTSLDAVALGAPVLAWEFGMARGRQTAAMLRIAGVPELIADSGEGYVASALELLGAPRQRAALGERLRTGAHRLFDSAPTLAAFQTLLESLARGAVRSDA
jgi:predicted O-linked N-acetylglucosamine transferase (SPINDLY family)